jgi:predicted nuclease with TOPRIM domain
LIKNLKEKLEEGEMSKQGRILGLKNSLKDKEKIVDAKQTEINSLKNENKNLGEEIKDYKDKHSKLLDKFRQTDSKLSDKTSAVEKLKNKDKLDTSGITKSSSLD